MALTTYDSLIARVASGYNLNQPIYGSLAAATTSSPLNLSTAQFNQFTAETKALPALPSGVTAYIPTQLSLSISVANAGASLLVAKCVDLGNLLLNGTTAGVFTDGSAMPTITEAGVSRVTSGAVIAEVTTVLSGTPGSLTITYTDQDGNTGHTSTTQAMTASTTVAGTSWIRLASPDIGVRDITGAARSGSTTSGGVIQFWGIIPLCIVSYPGTNSGFVESVNLLTSSFNPIRLGAGDRVRVFSTAFGAKATVGQIHFIGDN